MKNRLSILIRTTLFWVLFMVFIRIVFMLYNNQFSFQLSLLEWIKVFANGLRMDISISGYFLAVWSLILTLSVPFGKKIFKPILSFFHYLFLVFSSVIAIVDMELYANWGFRLDATPLLYLKNPKEAMASTETGLSIALFLATIALIAAGIWIYRRYILSEINKLKPEKWYFIPVFLIITGSMILPVRGSLGIAPMNLGMVYHSTNPFANHAAINVVWCFGKSVSEKDAETNSYHFFKDEVAEQMFEAMNQQEESTIPLLNTERPNIVIIILESFTSKLIEPLGGKPGVTPNLNALSTEGIFFTNFLANSDRSDKGMVNILSGFPTHPTRSIMKKPGKAAKLSFLSKKLMDAGYSSSFYYGGDINFANMRAYLNSGGFQHIIDVHGFDSKLNNSKWGVHDAHVFQRLYTDIQKDKEQPFLKVYFTLSSHDPFEVPMKTVIEGSDRNSKFMNSAYYTDKHLGIFFDKMKKTEAWNNTLFILLADHGSPRPGNSKAHEKAKFRIPMLWEGGVIRKDTTIASPGMQVDLAKTLLNQLKIPSDDFIYSRDILSQDPPKFALYSFNNGFGIYTDSAYVVYGRNNNEIIEGDGPKYDEALLNNGKAYYQKLINDYLSK